MQTVSAESVPGPGEEGERPLSKVSIVGYFVVAGRHVSGWTWDKASPELSLHVQLQVDGEALTSTMADRQRGDLERAGVGTGKYGFTFILPESVLAEEAGRVNVLASRSPDHSAVPLTNRSLPRPLEPDVQEGLAIQCSAAVQPEAQEGQAERQTGDRRGRDPVSSSSPLRDSARQVVTLATEKTQLPVAPVEENLRSDASKPLLTAISSAEKATADRLDALAAEVRSFANAAAVRRRGRTSWRKCAPLWTRSAGSSRQWKSFRRAWILPSPPSPAAAMQRIRARRRPRGHAGGGRAEFDFLCVPGAGPHLRLLTLPVAAARPCWVLGDAAECASGPSRAALADHADGSGVGV